MGIGIIKIVIIGITTKIMFKLLFSIKTYKLLHLYVEVRVINMSSFHTCNSRLIGFTFPVIFPKLLIKSAKEDGGGGR